MNKKQRIKALEQAVYELRRMNERLRFLEAINPWTPWDGRNPRSGSGQVNVVRRDGTIINDVAAAALRWRHSSGPDDIIAYRDLKE